MNSVKEIPLNLGIQLQIGSFPEMEENLTPCLAASRMFNS
jgi:hypothetical protein